jgi:hypothetical protein
MQTQHWCIYYSIINRFAEAYGFGNELVNQSDKF